MMNEVTPTLERTSPSPAAPANAAGMAAMVRRALGATLAVPEVGALVPLVILLLIFAAFSPAFLSPESLAGLLRAVQFLAVIAIGQAVLLIVGELDLSVGAVAGLGSILAAWLMKEAGWPFPLALSAALLAGAGVGLVNGVIPLSWGSRRSSPRSACCTSRAGRLT